MPYIPPSPPKLSAAHRYVFLVYEQPEGLDAAKITSALGLPAAAGASTRMRWDQEACEKELGLGEIIAANYFLSKA